MKPKAYIQLLQFHPISEKYQNISIHKYSVFRNIYTN